LFRTLARYTDRFLAIVKWPVGVVVLLLLPAVVAAVGSLIGEVILAPAAIVPFVAGFVGYWAIWHLLFKRPAWGSLLSTFEHELTHAIFAWLTFHRVVGLRATWRDGGEIRYRGRGNWLITIAPYFFPTITVLFLVVLLVWPGEQGLWADVVIGLTAAYHGTSTWLETHRRQPDLRRVKIAFALLFLPTANVVGLGLVIAYAHGGSASMGRLLQRAGDHVSTWMSALL